MKKDANKRGELILADVKKKTAGGGGERYNLNSKDKKEQAQKSVKIPLEVKQPNIISRLIGGPLEKKSLVQSLHTGLGNILGKAKEEDTLIHERITDIMLLGKIPYQP